MPGKPKGLPKTGGRTKGTPNKLTATMKEMVQITLQEMQGEEGVNMFDWACSNPTEFYKIAAKLIPTELQANVQATSVVWQEMKTYETKPEANAGT